MNADLQQRAWAAAASVPARTGSSEHDADGAESVRSIDSDDDVTQSESQDWSLAERTGTDLTGGKHNANPFLSSSDDEEGGDEDTDTGAVRIPAVAEPDVVLRAHTGPPRPPRPASIVGAAASALVTAPPVTDGSGGGTGNPFLSDDDVSLAATGPPSGARPAAPPVPARPRPRSVGLVPARPPRPTPGPVRPARPPPAPG